MWYVLFLRNVTRTQALNPLECKNEDEAEIKAYEFNRHNQDQTWNCVVAIPEYFPNGIIN